MLSTGFHRDQSGCYGRREFSETVRLPFQKKRQKLLKIFFLSSVTSMQKNIRRKGIGRSLRDLYDVISFFKQVEPEIVPIFVAKELQKLPPMTFDHVDATRLLRDILLLGTK